MIAQPLSAPSGAQSPVSALWGLPKPPGLCSARGRSTVTHPRSRVVAAAKSPCSAASVFRSTALGSSSTEESRWWHPCARLHPHRVDVKGGWRGEGGLRGEPASGRLKSCPVPPQRRGLSTLLPAALLSVLKRTCEEERGALKPSQRPRHICPRPCSGSTWEEVGKQSC